MTVKKKTGEILLKRIEPLSWWVGMKTPLQLMLYGKNLRDCKIEIEEKGIEIQKIHQAESPDYLFIDIAIDPHLTPGEYSFKLKRGEESTTFSYLFDKRKKNSSSRLSFTSADTIYLLMPDRFANGDPSIDRTEDTVEKTDREEPFGRHGGDLQGIIDHLDYIADLGATALWITPPQLDNETKESYHGYACGDYYKIDPRFGDNNLYKELVRETHKKGLKIIIDAVPNHCGTAHWWMKNLPFHDWVHQLKTFTRTNYRLASVSDPNHAREDYRKTIDGWFDTTMPDMGTENPYVLQYLKQVYIWWIEWADLDGLRVDTFPYNEKHAIAEWTRSIREEYPKLSIVGECWHSSPAVVAYWDGAAINRDNYTSHLTSVMDFPMQEALDGALQKNSTEWNEGMNRVYEALALDFLYADPRSLLLFLDNHDTMRFADIVNGKLPMIKLGITLLATMRGIPQIYYGTEFGFRSTDLKYEHGSARKDFPGGWKGDRKNLFTLRNINQKEKDIYEHTRLIFNWRKSAKAIHEGKTVQFLPEGNTYSFIRYTDKETVLVYVNPSTETIKLDWKRYAEYLENYSSATEIISGKKIKKGSKVIIPGGEGVILDFGFHNNDKR